MSEDPIRPSKDETCSSCGETLAQDAAGEPTCPNGDYEPKIDWGLEDEDENDAPIEED